jgi:xanthine dehydrogenase YagT iron-sulfur-binding subunit
MPDSEQRPEYTPPAGAALAPVRLRVNSTQHDVLIEPRRTLLSVLRRDLHLTGAKPGCEMGNCGACTVLLDGQAFYSCLLLAIECEGKEITTIEGLAAGGSLDPVQEAFIAHDAVQCGFCTPGQILAVKALLAASPHPDDETISRGLSGNICRCGTYPKIIRAVKALAESSSEPQ